MTSQTIYFDFDGAETAYHGELLSIDDILVADSGLTGRKVAVILANLNARYAAQGVRFVADRPVGHDYSTIFVGKTRAFDAYGDVLGLSETIDQGNRNHSDNAFVNLDATAPVHRIVDTIAHETDHLLGTLDHGGTGLERYMAHWTYTLLESEWFFGTFEEIPTHNMTNRSDSGTCYHWLTVTACPGTAQEVVLSVRRYFSGKPQETVPFFFPSMQKILTALDLSVGGVSPSTYAELYGHSYTLREEWEVESPDEGYGYVDNTLTFEPTGVILLQADSLEEDYGWTEHEDALVMQEDMRIAGVVVGTGHAGNLVVNGDGSWALGEPTLANATITQGGRAEITYGGRICDTIVENGGVIMMEDASGTNITVSMDGTAYVECSDVAGTVITQGGIVFAEDSSNVEATVVQQGGSLFTAASTVANTVVQQDGILDVYGGTAINLTVQSGGYASLSNHVSFNELAGMTWEDHGLELYGDEDDEELQEILEEREYWRNLSLQNTDLHNDHVIEYGGQLHIEDQIVWQGGEVDEREYDSTLTLDLAAATGTEAHTYAMVENFQYLPDNTNITINVNAHQQAGKYFLASGATLAGCALRDVAITVNGNVDRTYGASWNGLLATGQAIRRQLYKLVLEDDNLFFTVSAQEPGMPGSGAEPYMVFEDHHASATVAGKSSQTLLVGHFAPGAYTVSGDFAAGLNATITVTDLATGKKAGTVAVKKGAIAKPTTLLLDGDYMVTIAGDGKSSGVADVVLEGLVHSAADHSDDTIGHARRAEAVSQVAGTVGFGDAIDWFRTEIDAAGRYTVSLTGVDAAAKATVTLWSSADGGAPKKVASQSGVGKDLSLANVLLAAPAGTEYFVSVSCDNAAKGAVTPYQLTIDGASYDVRGADAADNQLLPDSPSIRFRTEGVLDAATGTYLKTASVEGWVGYGDTADVLPFTVNAAGDWSIRLAADVPASVTLTLSAVSADATTGELVATKLASAKANAKGEVAFTQMLQGGDYALTVTCNDGKGDKCNTGYTIQLEETGKVAALDLVSGDTISLAKGESRTFTLNSMQYVSLDKTANLTLWTGNGKNGRTAVKLAYDKEDKAYGAWLKPGTYFLTASKAIYDVGVSTAYPDAYGTTLVTDDNGFATAQELSYGASSFVGYGDGIDCYRLTIDGEEYAPGDYTISLGKAVSDCVQVSVFAKHVNNKGKVSYKQLGKFTHKTGEWTDLALANLLDGDYYIKVESLSYADAAKAKSTTYKLYVAEELPYTALELGTDLGSSDSILEKGQFGYYRGEGDGTQMTTYRIDARVANGYEVYVHNGDGKLAKVKTYADTFVLRDDQLFYVKATKDDKNYSQGVSLSIVSSDAPGTLDTPYWTAPQTDNRQRLLSTDAEDGLFTGWYGWIGYGAPSETLEFDTYAGGIQAGWATFEIDRIVKSLGDASAISFSLTLEQNVNGKWKKVAATNAKYSYDSKKQTWQLNGKDLSANLAADADYRLVVATSDKGAGQCSGAFRVTGSVDAYDTSNDTLATPTHLEGDGWAATVVKKGDAVDLFDLSEAENFFLDVESGSVKLSFYDEDYRAVAVTGKYLTGASGQLVGALKNATSATLKAGDSKSDGLYMAAPDLLDYGIRFARVEAAGTANNHYRITTGMLGA